MRRVYRSLWTGLALLLLLQSAPAVSAEHDLGALRAELDALRADYETRITTLEQRLRAAEQQLALAQAQPPAPATGRGSTAYAGSDNAFNPAIGVILSGALRAYDKDPDDHVIPGVPAGGESGLGEEGLSIGESEFIFSANVDDWFYGQLTMALEQEDGEFEVGLEEAFLDTLRLPAGATLRFGRFYSAVGYLNDKHPHSWDFSDQALPYRAFLGGQYGDDGIQLRWLAPTDRYLELGAEVFRGSSYPAAGASDDGLGARSLFARTGGDLGPSHSWRAGLAWLGADADDRSAGDEEEPLRFDGSADLYIADFVWKWAPDGNYRERNLVFQAEYLWRNEDGSYRLPGGEGAAPIDSDAAGWYAQLVYQWRPRWRAGLRLDGLELDDPGPLFAGTALAPDGDPRRYTAMIDYSNSEFSRLRLQFERDESGPEDNNLVELQYIMSIGAHGAHAF